MNRQIGRLFENQTVGMVEQIRQGIDQLGRHAEQGLQQARSVVEQGVDKLDQAAQEARTQQPASASPKKS